MRPVAHLAALALAILPSLALRAQTPAEPPPPARFYLFLAKEHTPEELLLVEKGLFEEPRAVYHLPAASGRPEPRVLSLARRNLFGPYETPAGKPLPVFPLSPGAPVPAAPPPSTPPLFIVPPLPAEQDTFLVLRDATPAELGEGQPPLVAIPVRGAPVAELSRRIQFLNFSRQTIAVASGDDRLLLPPLSVQLAPTPHPDQSIVKVRFGLEKDGDWELRRSLNLKIKADRGLNCIITFPSENISVNPYPVMVPVRGTPAR